MWASVGATALAMEPPPDPRLVVLIVIDQLRGDFLTRFERHFDEGGFRRLLEEGAFFPNAYFSYGVSTTGPGHATIATGTLPRYHGITANKWHRAPEDTRAQASVFDSHTQLVGLESSEGAGRSPRMLLGTTLADEMKLADRRTRVFSVSLKDRGAVLLAGHRPDGAFWWDARGGRFVTSTYYADALPGCIATLNESAAADQFSGALWTPLKPADVYAGTWPLDTSWHPVYQTFGAKLPHKLPTLTPLTQRPYYQAVFASPYGNDLVLEVAGRLVTAANLGRGDAPDLLCISLSSNDGVGHVFGPDSAEVLDVTLRTDRQLERFLDFLDQRVGLDHCVVALTGDHGATSSPRVAGLLDIPSGFLDLKATERRLNTALAEGDEEIASGGPLIREIDPPWVYCSGRFAALDQARNQGLTRKLVRLLRETPGLDEVYTAEELSGPAPHPEDAARYLAWRSYHPKRSGQFYVKMTPYWYMADEELAGHSSGSRSDRHVPLVIAGWGVRSGRYTRETDPMDLSVTLAALLGIEAPSHAVGRVLHEAIADPGDR
jgi:predicted AlkP superfamily pyrophosphatase or phosphodiesterase